MIRRLSLLFALVAASLVTPALAAPAGSNGPMCVQANNKKDTDKYSLELKATGPYKAGVEATFDVSLKAKSGHHINLDYPTKFQLKAPAPNGVTYPKNILRKDDGKFSEQEGTLKVAFRANNAGKQTIPASFHFSVCSDKNCFVEKLDVDVEVDVK